MNLLTLKGGLYELISRIEDEALLIQLQNVVKEVIEENKSDFWDELDSEQQAALEKALQESQQEENLVTHQLVLNKYQQWPKK